MVKNPPAMQEDPWVGEIPCKTECLPTPVFLPGEFHGQRGLVGYSPQGVRESDMTELLTFSLFHVCGRNPEKLSHQNGQSPHLKDYLQLKTKVNVEYGQSQSWEVTRKTTVNKRKVLMQI